MTPPIQFLDPDQIDKFPSLKIYAEKCQEQASKDGKGPEGFDATQVIVSNRSPGDGTFEILANNPDKDFFCSSQINWQNHEMLIKGGVLSTRAVKPIGALWMSDACSVTKALASEGEFAGKSCTDGQVDPRIAAISQMDSVQFYLKECDKLLSAKGQSFGMDWSGKVIPNRVFMENTVKGDGVYSLKFASGAYDFICEGQVDTLAHLMSISSGPADKKKGDEQKVSAAEELTDDCSMTRKTLGENELVGECKDRTKRERAIETGLEWTWKGLMTGLAVRDVYQFVRKRPTMLGKAWRLVRNPGTTFSQIGQGLSRAGTAIRGVPALVSETGTAIRGFGALRAAGFLGRIPGFLGGGAAATAEGGAVATAGGAGTGAAAGGGAVATAGIGATVGVAAAGFAIGVGIGVLIENVPRWCGSKYSVSDGIAWGIDSGVGLTAGAVSLVTGKSTTEVKEKMTRTNIEFLDSMGFGGWNAFKQSWGI